MKEDKYTCTNVWWDEEDNEFILCATWQFEKNYPDMPDQWHLEDLEVEDYSQRLSEGFVEEVKWMCGNDREIWRYVENQGPSFEDLAEVDYI